MYRRICYMVVIASVTTLSAIGFSSCRKNIQAQPDTTTTKPKRPNIVMVVADDMGYSDLSPFGSSINTPNLEALAKEGIKLTNFHTGPGCSPSRSMMMTGIGNHPVGLATMDDAPQSKSQKGQPGYEGTLNKRAVILPELLKDNGYNTYISGKWHLGKEPGFLPRDRGYTDGLAMLLADSTHFSISNGPGLGPAPYLEWDQSSNPTKQLTSLPKDFYSTTYFTDKGMEMIERNRNNGKPFFLFLSFTAPHLPMQAPKAYLDKYKGKFDEGWDVFRQKRFDRMKQLGLIPANIELPPRASGNVPWDSLTPQQKKYEAKRMEIYAAMIEYMDHSTGRLINYLKSIGEYDNTIFLFMSDNGGSGRKWEESEFFATAIKKEKWDNSYENIGNDNSYITIGPGWANVSSTPFYEFKGRVSEGGTRVPVIMSYKGFIQPNSKSHAFLQSPDFMPTFLDYLGIEHPGTTYKGRPNLEIEGRSFRSILEGKATRIYGEDEPIGFELFGTGNSALFMGDWKILKLEPKFQGKWKLFNLAEDPRELVDLSGKYPDRLKKMVTMYEEFEKKRGVIPADPEVVRELERI